MSDQQLWLFAQPKPLRERLGNDFFGQVPRRPGVYLMLDRQQRVLYVGQSGNLRHRLNSYKNIRPETSPRKLVRLARAITTITWQECDTAEAARLRENELLRLHRPRFNVVNTRPEAYGFIGLRGSEEQLELWLTQEIMPADELYGAFKGLRWSGYRALLRLLAFALNHTPSPEHIPAQLLGPKPPRRVHFQLGPGVPGREGSCLLEGVRAYLEGRSNELMDILRRCLPVRETLPPFWRQLQDADMETVGDFYERGPRRNRRLREEHGLADRIIAPANLDDLLVRSSGTSRRLADVARAPTPSRSELAY